MCYIADLARQVKGTQKLFLSLVTDFLLFSLDLPHPAYFQRAMQATGDSASRLPIPEERGRNYDFLGNNKSPAGGQGN